MIVSMVSSTSSRSGPISLSGSASASRMGQIEEVAFRKEGLASAEKLAGTVRPCDSKSQALTQSRTKDNC